MRNKIIGRFGEDLAANYLQRHGYDIIAKNYQASHQEIDIIARQHSLLVFVEVKTRTAQIYGDGTEAYNYFKQQALRNGINFFLHTENIAHKDIRADLIIVQINKALRRAKIKHYEDVL